MSDEDTLTRLREIAREEATAAVAEAEARRRAELGAQMLRLVQAQTFDVQGWLSRLCPADREPLA